MKDPPYLGLGLAIGLELIREDTSLRRDLTDRGRGNGLADLNIRRHGVTRGEDKLAHASLE